MSDTCSQGRKDWVATPGSFALGWGLPGIGLVAALFLDSPAKAILWPAALVWMGIACLANAARCRGMHCYFTGPFFLLMALLSLLHGFEIVRLGPQGWTWIDLTAAAAPFYGGCPSMLGANSPVGGQARPQTAVRAIQGIEERHPKMPNERQQPPSFRRT